MPFRALLNMHFYFLPVSIDFTQDFEFFYPLKFFPLLGFSLLRYSLLVTSLLCLVTPGRSLTLYIFCFMLLQYAWIT